MADYLVRSEYDRARLINFLQSADLAKPIKVTVTEIKEGDGLRLRMAGRPDKVVRNGVIHHG